MKITRITKAGVRKTVGTERVEPCGSDKRGADRVAISQAAVRHLTVRETPAHEAVSEALDSLTPDRKTQARCRKIAARIRAGDHVPLQDRKYLEQYDSMSYQLAMAMRHIKARPRHWDSVVRDQDPHKPSAAGVVAVLATDRGHGPNNQAYPRHNVPAEEEEV